MSNRKTLPSKSSIFNYWNNKVWEEYHEFGYDYVSKYPYKIWNDSGEPDCWACGRYDPNYNDIHEYVKKVYGFEYRDRPEKDDTKYINSMWDNATLERHHIIPHSLGGKDTEDNLFLLCGDCHENAPHANDYEGFIRWAKHRKENICKNLKVIIEDVLKSNDLDISNPNAEGYKLANAITWFLFEPDKEVNHYDLYKEFEQFSIDNLSFHFSGTTEAYFRDRWNILIKWALSKNKSIEEWKQIDKERWTSIGNI